MTLPIAEVCIKQALSGRYSDGDWRPALNTLMDAEGDTEAVIATVESLANAAASQTGLKIQIPALPKLLLQLINEFVNPAAERLIDEEFALDDREIVAEVEV
ncbi:hypothetical protein SERLA73DRAFT_70069 [Serpula lacrymans var. lacrymans S7.3]|uniref:Uncharacterized protein n=1 Tax=Serpula lacrymans var. lacrymans (strain S7.3) TaxID=936435 RepID=F8PLS7_SERL3|nr:hypothetical protein SERLA73DRAFT_70069 [Serpula lacrymans var. lacrymans S7.3]